MSIYCILFSWFNFVVKVLIDSPGHQAQWQTHQPPYQHLNERKKQFMNQQRQPKLGFRTSQDLPLDNEFMFEEEFEQNTSQLLNREDSLMRACTCDFYISSELHFFFVGHIFCLLISQCKIIIIIWLDSLRHLIQAKTWQYYWHTSNLHISHCCSAANYTDCKLMKATEL